MIACTPRLPFGCTECHEGYVHTHADQLVQVVAEVVVVDQLDQYLDLAAVVIELRSSFVELLDDVADLSSCLP